MKIPESIKQQSLETLYLRLNSTISNLYHMAFSIGLQWEWQELKHEIKHRGWLPVDMAYLKVIEHAAMPGMIKMIEILEEVRERLSINESLNMEGLSPSPEVDSLQSDWLTEDCSEEENLDRWQQSLYIDLLSIFEACWKLEHGCHPTMPVYDAFAGMYFNASLQITSEDAKVQTVIEALNKVLRVNRRAVFVV